MLSDQIITRKPPASYNKQYIRNVFFLFVGGGAGAGGGRADVKTSCQAALFLLAQYMTQTDIVRVIFSSLLRHARLSTFL